MIALRFSGYFQCRLPTDPDPSDEPRGVSGTIWAVAGEPDLDRVIRFQRPVAPRSETPPIGVRVREIVDRGVPAAAHPLLGAPVDLVGEPRFEGRNGIVAQSGSEPIAPFRIRIAANGIVAERDSGFAMPYAEMGATARVDRSIAVIGAATGEWNFAATLRKRRGVLEELHSAAKSATARAALAARMCGIDQNGFFMTLLHATRMIYAFSLRGDCVLSDRYGRLTNPLSESDPWTVEFWLGGWDADAMSGYVDGWLTIPEHGERIPVRRPAPVDALEFDKRLAGGVTPARARGERPARGARPPRQRPG